MPVSKLPKLQDYLNNALKDIDFNEGVFEVDFIKTANYSKMEDLIFDLESGKSFWGQGCQEPIIAIESLPLKQSMINICGKNKNTLRFSFNGVTYIKFNATKEIEKLIAAGNRCSINIVGKTDVNHYMGSKTAQIKIIDLEVVENNELF